MEAIKANSTDRVITALRTGANPNAIAHSSTVPESFGGKVKQFFVMRRRRGPVENEIILQLRKAGARTSKELDAVK
jgi:hypothetical protein